MKSKIANELHHFQSYPRNMRYLLLANMLYAFVLPVIELFVGAYIVSPPDGSVLMSPAERQDNIELYLFYQFAVYLGTPLCFVLNGYLLKWINVARLYSVGLILSGISMGFMMTLQDLSPLGVIVTGLIMGASYGFFWANRDFMSLEVTTDSSRNYYFSLDTIFYTLTWIIVPSLVGFIVAYGQEQAIYTQKSAYIGITMVVFVLSLLAVWIVNRVKFTNPKNDRFLFFKYDRLWIKMLLLAATKGIMQGTIMIFPILLILSIIGGVNMLGIIVSGGQIISAVMLYVIGRLAKPRHRFLIYVASILFFTAAIAIHCSLYSVLGVILYNVLQFVAKPFHDVSYFPTEFKIIDWVCKKESRSEYTYIVSHEFALFLGRISAILIVLYLTYRVNADFALRYGLLCVAVIMLLSLLLCRNLLRDCDRQEKDGRISKI